MLYHLQSKQQAEHFNKRMISREQHYVAEY